METIKPINNIKSEEESSVEKIDLSRLRQCRGSNEAVKRLGDLDDGMKEFYENPLKFGRKDLLASIMKNYSGEAYGDYQWRKITGGWTTPEVLTQYGEFRRDFENYSELSLDAGFMTHLPEFMERIKSDIPDNLDCQEAREKFKEALGETVVWRGIMLNEEELDNIKKNGIESPLVGHMDRANDKESEFEAMMISSNMNDLVEKHFHGESMVSPLVSVSARKDVAIAVGRGFGKKSNNRKFYLFKIAIPEIDRVYYTEHAVRKSAKLESLQSKLAISVNGDTNEYEWDKDVESFLFWKIDPDEIMEISQPDVNESSWNNKKVVGRL